MDNNHADALLNMELEQKLQNRIATLMMNDVNLRAHISQVLLNDYSFMTEVIKRVGYKLTTN